MSDETEREVEVFGILVQFSVLAPKPTVVSVEPTKFDVDEDVTAGGGGGIDDFVHSYTKVSQSQPSSGPPLHTKGEEEAESSEDVLDMGVVMNELHKKKKNSLGESPVGTPKSSPK